MARDANAPAEPATDASRRTWLAAERTWLAWWRTGLGAAAVAIAVGRLVPTVTHGARWPLRLIGIGYGVTVAALVVGAIRQRRTTDALLRGGYEALSSPLVTWLPAGAIALSVATIALIAVKRDRDGGRDHQCPVDGHLVVLRMRALLRAGEHPITSIIRAFCEQWSGWRALVVRDATAPSETPAC